MKRSFFRKLLPAALLLLSCGQSWAAVVSYNPGDLLLGFRATGGTGATQDYVVNIGQASLYRDAFAAFTVSVGNIGADLATVFGANWHTRSDVLWSVSGTPGNLTPVGSDPAKTLYATRPEDPAGTTADAWKRQSSTNQGTTSNKMASLASGYSQTAGIPNVSTLNSDFGVIQNTADVNSYASFMPGGVNSNATTAFSAFNPGIEGNFGNGTAGAVLDLFRMLNTGGANGGTANVSPGTFEGRFTISNTGVLTFTPDAIPEPGIAMLLGAFSAFGIRRRRVAAAH